MSMEEKILNKIQYLSNVIEKIKENTEHKKIEINIGVQHSIIWGIVLLLLALIIKWMII